MSEKPESFLGRWEQRWHPLRREWVVYSAHRNSRPWTGENVEPDKPLPEFDEHCYLCPGNTRISGKANPAYEGIYVFDNDHPVTGPLAPDPLPAEGPYRSSPARGGARVVCYDPRHNLQLVDLPVARTEALLREWAGQVRDLSARPEVEFVLIFENKGEAVGTSCPHPHCQIYATNFTFKHVSMEKEALLEWEKEKGGNLFDAVLEQERKQAKRIVAENDHAIAFVPYFARYPYEVWVFPKRRRSDLTRLDDDDFKGLAAVYHEVNRRFDGLYGRSFPYVMSLYQAPLKDGWDDYHLHFVFLPPLRSPAAKKFPAGPEIGGGNFMNDTVPEKSAAQLRSVNLAG